MGTVRRPASQSTAARKKVIRDRRLLQYRSFRRIPLDRRGIPPSVYPGKDHLARMTRPADIRRSSATEARLFCKQRVHGSNPCCGSNPTCRMIRCFQAGSRYRVLLITVVVRPCHAKKRPARQLRNVLTPPRSQAAGTRFGSSIWQSIRFVSGMLRVRFPPEAPLLTRGCGGPCQPPS